MKPFTTIVQTIFTAVLFAVLVSCASGPYTQSEPKVLKLISLINEGKVTKVEGLTPAPFALDTETLYLENDIETFWLNLHKASFTMSDAVFVSSELVGPDSYKQFADTFDMKNFFAQYTGKDTSIVTVETGEGTYFLLLERAVRGYPRIRGLKGPTQ